MSNYYDIAMTPSVLALEEMKGSLALYADSKGDGSENPHDLEEMEIEMVTTRDSFYLASVSETGWPYVQHRGGEAGFIHLLNTHTIGWAERKGNRQYVGTGNIGADGRVAAIFMDYPTKTRLKLFGRATYDSDPSPELLARLGAEDVRTDGAIIIEVLATNWNCPKYITPRYTVDQVRLATSQLEDRITELEAALAAASTGHVSC